MMYSARSTGSMELLDDGPGGLQGKLEGVPVARFPKLVDFENAFRDPEDQESLKSRLSGAISKMISSCSIKKSVVKVFPIIQTFRHYGFKNDLPNDIIAGLTSGIMMIPQGMAFAALSTLPPIVGLYISFFASITYFFFGTGRQLSWGCIAVLSLMMATVLEKYDNSIAAQAALTCINGTAQVVQETVSSPIASNISNFTLPSKETSSEEENAAVMSKRIEVASGISVVAGIVLVVASRLGLSRITSIMSNSLITGFTVGISFHVATSQIKTMFGLAIPRYSGIAAIVKTWIAILKNLPDTNLASLIISVISMLVIYLVKKCINERYKKKMRIPIPIELFVVIAATLISNYTHLHDNFSVKVVEEVPVGVPAPKFPDLSMATDYIGDGIVIIVVAYAQTLAMAKTMGLKHNYVIDSNQEMLACGAVSIVCGLFSGYISAASVSRSVVQDGAGGRTQLASLFAAGLVLLVILLIGPYFYYLPMCVLSAIIVVNLRTMFLKLLDIPKEWRKSRYDCAVWVFAWAACVILNADIGLLAGIVFSLLLVLLRGMLTPVVEAGQIQTGPLNVELRSINNYSSARQIRSVKIIKIRVPLYFVNADLFTTKVFSKIGIDPIKLKKQVSEIQVPNTSEQKASVPDKEVTETNGLRTEENSKTYMLGNNPERSEVKVVILDAAEVTFIDLMGVQALQFLVEEYTSVDVEVFITSIPENIIPMLKSTGFWDKYGSRLFMSVEAALASLVTAVTNPSHSDICYPEKEIAANITT